MLLRESNILELSTDEFYKWRFEFYIIAIDTTGSNEIRVFKLASIQVDSRSDTIHDFMAEYLWHLGTGNWEHAREYYEGDGSETLDL